jgi:GNAT superfamily N-acetyltransferase
MVAAAEQLYEATLDADERIPWLWIKRAVGERVRQPGTWVKHLVLAADSRIDDPAALLGYAYGAFLPGYGGYVCYVGVAEAARRRGVGRRLFESLFKAFEADAAEAGQSLPFVIWESYRPGPDDPVAAHAIWESRVRLFDKVGGLWVEGVDFLSPDFTDPDGPPVPLQLFIKPVGLPAAAFDAERLRQIIGGLLERVYREQPGDVLYDGTLPPDLKPRLVPAVNASGARLHVVERKLIPSLA